MLTKESMVTMFENHIKLGEHRNAKSVTKIEVNYCNMLGEWIVVTEYGDVFDYWLCADGTYQVNILSKEIKNNVWTPIFC